MPEINSEQEFVDKLARWLDVADVDALHKGLVNLWEFKSALDPDVYRHCLSLLVCKLAGKVLRDFKKGAVSGLGCVVGDHDMPF